MLVNSKPETVCSPSSVFSRQENKRLLNPQPWFEPLAAHSSNQYHMRVAHALQWCAQSAQTQAQRGTTRADYSWKKLDQLSPWFISSRAPKRWFKCASSILRAFGTKDCQSMASSKQVNRQPDQKGCMRRISFLKKAEKLENYGEPQKSEKLPVVEKRTRQTKTIARSVWRYLWTPGNSRETKRGKNGRYCRISSDSTYPPGGTHWGT